MNTVLAIAAAVGGYFLAMAFLLFPIALLKARGGVFGLLNVQPYRSLLKLAVIALSAWAGYAVFGTVAG